MGRMKNLTSLSAIALVTSQSSRGRSNRCQGVAASAIRGSTDVAGEADTCNSAYRVTPCALSIL
jgi:hypothetical protein